ncbi:MAG: acyl-CoA dehydrogenase family protein [Deltaproteobacteria bacterium]|nr:acyl-CoA dehydrogenase family protein [Deltaproteobacteria bacterium]MBW2723846.1 acyl-CoA dehydrogenase family protein [Deltaproteobacteria bacterium]
MDLEYGQRYEDFRNEVRGFLDEHKPKKPIAGLSSGEGRKTLIDWLSLQIEHGYWARTIPKEYGGYGASPDLLETVIMDEEFNRVGVVRGLPAQGPSMLVPTLLEHGTEEQKKRWIGPTMRAEVMWCQGYSEPGSGSDLASLQTSGREDGDDFLINGQKIWTSSADKSEMIFVLVRTEPDASKHAGISYLLAPMDTPGIEVQQLRTMSGNLGENSFNQVFFTDVRVPQSNIVGKRGEGWKIANTTLKHERNSLNSNGEGSLVRLMKLMNQETVNGVSAMANPVFRDRLMKLQGRVLSMKHHGMRMLTCSLQGESPGVAGLIIKLQNCQLNFDMASLAIDVMGELGVLYDHTKYERDRGYWQSHSIFSLGLIIGGGTAQIQKNIISERGLGMPREPKPAKA